MIDLTLSKETSEYVNLAKDFAENEIFNTEADDEESLFPQKALESAWNLGLLYGRIPEELGGLNLSFADQCALLEAIAFISPATALTLATSELAVSACLYAGTESQQKQYLPALLSDFQLFGLIHAPMQTHAEANQTSNINAIIQPPGYVVRGQGLTGINCHHAAWILIVDELSEKGSKIFIIPGLSEGLKTGARKNFLGLRQADICAFELESVPVSTDNVIEMTQQQSTKWISSARLLLATIACGIIDAALQHSVSYSKERHTFGKPIHSYQSISFMMSDMAKDLNAARLMIRKGAKFFQTRTGEYTDIHSYAAATHAFATEAAIKAATEAVQIFGGYGYSKEYPVERLMRDAKMLQLILSSTLTSKHTAGNTILCATP